MRAGTLPWSLELPGAARSPTKAREMASAFPSPPSRLPGAGGKRRPLLAILISSSASRCPPSEAGITRDDKSGKTPARRRAGAIPPLAVPQGMLLGEQIVIGTPGTMLDWCFKRRVVDVRKITLFVLDEADIMIDTQGLSYQSIRVQRWVFLTPAIPPSLGFPPSSLLGFGGIGRQTSPMGGERGR